MNRDQRVGARINRVAITQYMDMFEGSERALAKKVGVSHTLVQQVLRDPSKRWVNLATAKKFEKALGAPSNIIFLPELLANSSNAA